MVFSARGYSTAKRPGLYIPCKREGKAFYSSLNNAICSAMNDAEEPLALNVLYSPVKVGSYNDFSRISWY
jgi:hypothetical protein